MPRINGFYKVKHHGKERIMMWTSTDEDNSETISGFWTGHNGYNGNDHDMDFIDEKLISNKNVLELLNKQL